MLTGRTANHDGDLGHALRERVEMAGDVSPSSGTPEDRGPTNGYPRDLPEIGSEAFDALNRRRAELIDKDVAGQLTGAEREEMARLEQLCSAVVDGAFPLPAVDLDTLIRLRDSLRAEKEGRGA